MVDESLGRGGRLFPRAGLWVRHFLLLKAESVSLTIATAALVDFVLVGVIEMDGTPVHRLVDRGAFVCLGMCTFVIMRAFKKPKVHGGTLFVVMASYVIHKIYRRNFYESAPTARQIYIVHLIFLMTGFSVWTQLFIALCGLVTLAITFLSTQRIVFDVVIFFAMITVGFLFYKVQYFLAEEVCWTKEVPLLALRNFPTKFFAKMEAESLSKLQTPDILTKKFSPEDRLFIFLKVMQLKPFREKVLAIINGDNNDEAEVDDSAKLERQLLRNAANQFQFRRRAFSLFLESAQALENLKDGNIGRQRSKGTYFSQLEAYRDVRKAYPSKNMRSVLPAISAVSSKNSSGRRRATSGGIGWRDREAEHRSLLNGSNAALSRMEPRHRNSFASSSSSGRHASRRRRRRHDNDDDRDDESDYDMTSLDMTYNRGGGGEGDEVRVAATPEAPSSIMNLTASSRPPADPSAVRSEIAWVPSPRGSKFAKPNMQSGDDRRIRFSMSHARISEDENSFSSNSDRDKDRHEEDASESYKSGAPERFLNGGSGSLRYETDRGTAMASGSHRSLSRSLRDARSSRNSLKKVKVEETWEDDDNNPLQDPNFVMLHRPSLVSAWQDRPSISDFPILEQMVVQLDVPAMADPLLISPHAKFRWVDLPYVRLVSSSASDACGCEEATSEVMSRRRKPRGRGQSSTASTRRAPPSTIRELAADGDTSPDTMSGRNTEVPSAAGTPGQAPKSGSPSSGMRQRKRDIQTGSRDGLVGSGGKIELNDRGGKVEQMNGSDNGEWRKNLQGGTSLLSVGGRHVPRCEWSNSQGECLDEAKTCCCYSPCCTRLWSRLLRRIAQFETIVTAARMRRKGNWPAADLMGRFRDRKCERWCLSWAAVLQGRLAVELAVPSLVLIILHSAVAVAFHCIDFFWLTETQQLQLSFFVIGVALRFLLHVGVTILIFTFQRRQNFRGFVNANWFRNRALGFGASTILFSVADVYFARFYGADPKNFLEYHWLAMLIVPFIALPSPLTYLLFAFVFAIVNHCALIGTIPWTHAFLHFSDVCQFTLLQYFVVIRPLWGNVRRTFVKQVLPYLILLDGLSPRDHTEDFESNEIILDEHGLSAVSGPLPSDLSSSASESSSK